MSAKKKQQDQLPPYREVDDASSPADSESEAGGEEEPIGLSSSVRGRKARKY